MMASLALTLSLFGSFPVSAWSTAVVRIVQDEVALPSTPAQRGLQQAWKTPLPSTR